MTLRIAVLDDYADVARRFAVWPEGDRVTVLHETIHDQTKLASKLACFDVLCVMRERTPLNAGLIDALPNLRLIVTTGARNLSIDVAAAQERGILVSARPAPVARTVHGHPADRGTASRS